jgi:ABC-type Fe3+-hydroxamate transport system substrate-binding protein
MGDEKMRVKHFKKIAVLMLLVFAFSILSGCKDTGEKAQNDEPQETVTRTVTNLDGSEITVPKEVNKVGGKNETNMEQLLKWNPDFIFVDHAGSSGNASAEEVIGATVDDQRFKQLTAVQKEQVKVCPTGVFFWDAGQQKILLLMWMAKTLHTEKFEDLDMQKELKYFYKKFYDYELNDEQAQKILMHLPPEGAL